MSPAEDRFVDEIAARHGFERLHLERILSEARHDERIIAAISRPAEALPWYRYRRIFLTEDRIDGGVRYWQTHADRLREAEQKYGVPPQVVTAIIGIETLYGANIGKYRVIDALKTLGFGYPKRADFFRKELEQYLLMTREEKLDPLALVGSYAGAMGKPQFIASSFRRYAVDFDDDGQRDLWRSDADVIGSVASYLARHSWQRGGPVAQPVSGDEAVLAGLTDGGSKPDRRLSDLARQGIDVPAGEPERMARLIGLEQESGTDYWLGYDNFYAITRYNHSNLYAMAVHQLSEAIRERWLSTEGG